MEPIKAIGLLVVGILIGYSFAELSSENQALTSDVAPNIEKKLTDEKGNNSTIEEENISLIAKQIPCSKQCDQLSNDEANTLSKLTSVMEENSQLKQKYRVLEQKLLQSKHKINSLTRQIGELDESDITDEELLALVPKDYENLVINFRGQMRDEIYNFHHQPEDLDKGFDLSHNISSFIVSHADSFGVELNSVICKKSYCELLIKEKERPSWDRIFHDLSKQEWWKFNSTHSSSTSDQDENILIYNFMSIQSAEE